MKWTDSPLKIGYPNKAIYIQELRKALDEKRKEMGLSLVDWSEPIKIGEPKKFSHTQQLMLACEDTAKRYGFDSYQDILKREWTPIQQGGPYRHQIVNDLRQVVDGLVWLGFEERFPGTELDLNRWKVVAEGFPWYVNERLYFHKEVYFAGRPPDMASRNIWYGESSIVGKQSILFPPEFILEWDFYTYYILEYDHYPGLMRDVFIQLNTPWGWFFFYYESYADHYMNTRMQWSSNNAMVKGEGWHGAPNQINVKFIVKQDKQSLYVNGQLKCETFGSVDAKKGSFSIYVKGNILVISPPGLIYWWRFVADAWIDNIVVHRIKE